MPPRRGSANTPRKYNGKSSFADLNPFRFTQKSPVLSVCLVLVGVVILLCYSFSSSSNSTKSGNDQLSATTLKIEGTAEDEKEEFASRPECRTAVCEVLPLLRNVYTDSMDHILHVGPSACAVVLKLLKEEKAEAWGLLPFDPKPPVHSVCENLIRKGLVRVADVTQPFPYRSNSFSLVLANDIVDSMTSKQLNVTLRELARVTSESVVILVNGKSIKKMHDPTGEGIKSTSKTPKPRSKLWWQHHFQLYGLQESKEATERFESLLLKTKFKTSYYIFHLISTDIRR